MAIYSEFSHEKWWFSIVMLVYQRVKWMVFHAAPAPGHPHWMNHDESKVSPVSSVSVATNVKTQEFAEAVG